MKNIEECKNEIARNNNFDSFEMAIRYTFNRELLQSEKDFLNKIIDESIQLYAQQQVSVEPVVMQKIARENRYTFTGESITGYWIIRDKKDNNDATIFIDCPKEYMIKIVETLNSNFSA